MLNQDFTDILSAFLEENVEFIVVGAFAMSFHGYPRATGDIDLWIRRSDDNAKKIWRALEIFKAPLFDLKIEDLTVPEMVFQIGVVPNRIDIITEIDGVDFERAWGDKKIVTIEGLKIPVISKELLIENKKSTNRAKDKTDVLWMLTE